MPAAKSKLVSRKTAPSRGKYLLYIADDFRLERSGKVTAVGLYADKVIVVSLPSTSPEPSAQTPAAVETMAFLLAVNGLQGKYSVSIRLVGAGRTPAPEDWPAPKHFTFEGKEVSGLFILQSRPFAFTSYGEKWIEVKIDETVSRHAFEVRRGAPITPPDVAGDDSSPSANISKTRESSKPKSRIAASR